MTTDPIRDELHRLTEEFGKLLGNSESVFLVEKTTPEQLIQHFGLTVEEAKSWLEKEPNYEKLLFRSSDDSYHEGSNRRKVNRTENRKEYIYS